VRDLQLYEIGKVYSSKGERRSLVLAATGPLRVKTVHDLSRDFNFFDLKGDVEDLSGEFNLEEELHDGNLLPDYYHPGRAVRIGDLAVLGQLHPDLASEYKFKQPVYLAEIDAELLLGGRETRPIQSIPKFPSIRRDLSLLLPKNVRYADVENAVRNAHIPELIRVEPFDRLESGAFPDTKYALAISLTYQAAGRTLTDVEGDAFDKAILNSLIQRVGAELRQ
jgi:phenylalanyl-tRNA synthetase beta chain